jgi:transcriptional regulator with XRE-family HTH domain
MAGKRTTKNFAEVVRAELVADPSLAYAVDEERLHADIAEQILKLRTEASMTQKELAEKAGTKQSVISRIEDADYYGHSLSMLHRIARIFTKRLLVLFCDPGSVPTPLRGLTIVATNTVAHLANQISPQPLLERPLPATTAPAISRFATSGALTVIQS